MEAYLGAFFARDVVYNSYRRLDTYLEQRGILVCSRGVDENQDHNGKIYLFEGCACSLYFYCLVNKGSRENKTYSVGLQIRGVNGEDVSNAQCFLEEGGHFSSREFVRVPSRANFRNLALMDDLEYEKYLAGIKTRSKSS